MKKFKMLSKSFNVESPVLSAMFMGYFVLLVATATFIVKHTNNGHQSSMTATTEIQGDNHTTN